MKEELKEKLKCYLCGEEYEPAAKIWRCSCGGFFDLVFTPLVDFKSISSKEYDLWRYREALPISNDTEIISFQEGFTPLLEIEFSGRKIHVKQEYLFPTGSFKDRGAAVLVNKLRELNIVRVIEDSSGNAGAALAAYCARAGIECEIFASCDTAPGKLEQIKSYGALLNLNAETRQHAAELALEKAKTTYYASHSWNPYFFQGTKTFAFEICEQLNWESPDILVLPVGNGTLLLGAYLGFKDLIRAGIIKRLPRLIGVQLESCCPVYRSFNNLPEQNFRIDQIKSGRGIAISAPIRIKQIVSAIRESGGDIICVSSQQINKYQRLLAEMGFYLESTAVIAFAGLAENRELMSSAGSIITAFTGHGLKESRR
ncbi:MAG: threonine synthase [Candidatus Cloacimonetes bacterium]|nr:threonine synthase [Candidatus Cloacimonadota bacterium]